MKTEWLKAILMGCWILVVTGWGGIMAAEVNEGNTISAGEQPLPTECLMQSKPSEPGPEQFEQMLARIREKDPKKADELVQLRKKDPAAFKAELRSFAREQLMKPMREQKDTPGWWQEGKPKGPMPVPGERPYMGQGGPEMMQEWMREKNQEYMKWLKENFPDEATRLERLKVENPGQYMRVMGISWKKYGKIFQASQDNPELAKVLKEQMAMKEKRMELLRQIKATTDEKQKKALTGELEQVVSQQFDLIVKRKQIAYEDLAKKLEELKKEVEQRKAEVEKSKSKDYKNEQVKKRVSELLSETEKFEWE